MTQSPYLRVSVLHLLSTVKCFCATFIIFILTSFFYQIEPCPAYGRTAQENQTADAKPSPSAVEKPLSSNHATSSPGAAEGTADKVKKAEWIAIGINTFIALVIFWQAWIYNQQRKIMQAQKTMLAVTERAYLGVKSLAINPITNSTIVITVILQNGGRTPAWDFRGKSRMALIDAAPPVDWEMCADPITGSFIAAGGDKKMDFTPLENITQEKVDALNAKTATLFADAECRYLDHMGNIQVFTFGYSFDFRPDRWRAHERYQTHRTENPN